MKMVSFQQFIGKVSLEDLHIAPLLILTQTFLQFKVEITLVLPEPEYEACLHRTCDF